jgi:hypothetical protein
VEKKISQLNQSLSKNNLILNECNLKIKEGEKFLERERIIEGNLRAEVILLEESNNKKIKDNELNMFLKNYKLFIFFLFFIIIIICKYNMQINSSKLSSCLSLLEKKCNDFYNFYSNSSSFRECFDLKKELELLRNGF